MATITMEKHLANARAARDRKWKAAGVDRSELFRELARKRWSTKKEPAQIATSEPAKPSRRQSHI